MASSSRASASKSSRSLRLPAKTGPCSIRKKTIRAGGPFQAVSDIDFICRCSPVHRAVRKVRFRLDAPRNVHRKRFSAAVPQSFNWVLSPGAVPADEVGVPAGPGPVPGNECFAPSRSHGPNMSGGGPSLRQCGRSGQASGVEAAGVGASEAVFRKGEATGQPPGCRTLGAAAKRRSCSFPRASWPFAAVCPEFCPGAFPHGGFSFASANRMVK